MSEENVQNDMELIQRCRAGDEQAFGVLYQRYRLPLYSYLHRLLYNHVSLVDDIFQQVWSKALRSWDRYDDRQRLLAWLCRIGHNLVMDHYRRSRHLSQEALEDQDAVDQGSSGDEELADQELLAALEAAIETLPPEQREVVEFRRAGRSFKEIADAQGSSLNTVLGRMHYAIQKLRSCLKDYL